jgi:hypothetical protein
MKHQRLFAAIVIVFTLFLLGAARPAFAGFEAAARVGLFEPVDNTFETFYKQGLVEGVYAGWTNTHGLGALLGVDTFFTKVQYHDRIHRAYLIPVTLSCLYLPLPAERVTPLFGFGVGWYHLSDFSLFNHQSHAADTVGYHGFAGVRARLYAGLFSDLQIKYSYARVQSVSDINLGGWTSTLGVGYSF